MTSHSVYVILNYISVFIMLFSCVSIAIHPGNYMQKLALMVCMSLTMCCIGFLFRAEAVNAEEYLAGQKLVYAFVTHGMFIMLLFILNYCGFKLPQFLATIGHGMNLLISISVLTLNHHTLFYRSYRAIDMGGYCILEKEYGPLHTLAVGLFAVYMAAAVVTAIIYSVKNIHKRKRMIWMLLAAVMVPCVAYIIPKIIYTNNELQPMAFAVFMIIVQRMIFQNKLYDVDNIAAKYSIASVNEGLIVFDSGYMLKGWNARAGELFPNIKNLLPDTDVRICSPILTDMLDGAVTEYDIDGKVYGISVRPVSDDNQKNTIGRVLWIEDNTMEHNYMKLLQKQKKSLEKEVVTLSGYSYTDDLTGMENRRAYENKLTEIRNSGTTENVTVIAMDMNGLKKVNDTLGHSAGDELIRNAAQVITNTFAAYGSCYRTGGDEFFVLVTNSFPKLEEVYASFPEKASAWYEDEVGKLSISTGIANGKDHPGISIDELLKLADRDMYSNKRIYYAVAGVDRRHQ